MPFNSILKWLNCFCFFSHLPDIHFLTDNFKGQLHPLTALQRRFLNAFILFFSPSYLSFIHTDSLLEIEDAFLSQTGHLFL